MSMDKKLIKYLGLGFKQSGPYVTRRYTLIKKKKTRTNNKAGQGDIFIDVELFALDLNIRFFSPEKNKIENVTLGGLLDIPFMRPREFGYDVVRTLKKGVTYRNVNTNKNLLVPTILVQLWYVISLSGAGHKYLATVRTTTTHLPMFSSSFVIFLNYISWIHSRYWYQILIY